MKKHTPFIETLQTAAVQGLMQAPLHFCGLIDEMPLGIAIVDMEFRVIFVNRAFEALTGFSASDAVGIPCRHIIRSRACVGKCPGPSVMAKQKPASFESDIINRDRRRFSIRITLAPILSSDGTHTGYIETIEDIQSSKQFLPSTEGAFSFSDIVGRSPQMEKIFQTIPLLAQSDTSILITGETGTGKDLVAEAIHQTSTRASGPFIKINCGALPETLLESEIFGHKKGAFTGAVENKPGRFQLAHNGTIFLTEIGDLPLSLQVKLLTFLDDKIIYPLGSTKGFNADVRMVAATHRNLEEMVRAGKFRQDLFFRLNVARIHLPPLRTREGDVRLLIDHFLHIFSKEHHRPTNRIAPNALAILLRYHFAGNIRELRNIIEYAVNMAGDSPIEQDHLPAYLFDTAVQQTERTEEKMNINISPEIQTVFQNSDHVPTPSYDPSHDAPDMAASPTMPLHVSTVPATAPTSDMTWATAERQMIMDALIKAKGKKQMAAELLGWGRTTLWRKMKQYEID